MINNIKQSLSIFCLCCNLQARISLLATAYIKILNAPIIDFAP